MTQSPDILFFAEYIKNVLYFATVKTGKSLKNTNSTLYFSIDDELVYENYYSDFGPLNLGCVFKYCKILNKKLNQYLNKQVIVHYTTVDAKKKANSAFLLGCYGVLYLSLTPKDALKPILVQGQSYREQFDGKSAASRRGSGAGEPRPPRPYARSSTIRTSTQKNSAESTISNSKTITGFHPTITTFRSTNSPIIKNVNDARKFLIRSSLYNEERERQLNSSVTVTPHYSAGATNYLSTTQAGNMANITPSSFSTASKTTPSKQRRSLGRSPSPPQMRMPNEQTRATNTPTTPTKNFLAKDASKSALKDALSRLKLTSPRDGSIGAASLGAASLGARRDAPAPQQAPSVRSAALATQGDMLNSIKFQRRLRSSVQADKLSSVVKPNNTSISSKENTCIKRVGSRSSNAARPCLNPEFTSVTRAKAGPASRIALSEARPASPKGRRSPHTPSFY